MAQTVNQIIRTQLGNMLLEIAMLTAKVEALEEEKLQIAQSQKQVDPDGPR